ncbi:cytochrome c biogenesis protein CcdA [Citricoccus sp. NPDC079358]|jgi:cytochrome c biogenesis protein CcdA|uniref:Cytochrome c biogenesis CcdA family protein n=3 Tax=Citricoccus TaxID=169133 RepID=A0ABV5G935_9MICC|nr:MULTISPECIES: cytochrome c biogenesis protein CcdA [Citricoccus]GGO49913.1 cytochrome C biogenesis protein CcdA [Citricoccus zhacaiensis]VXC19546.1 Cytochrome c-type biogenesis protein CcdA (DsbD analog) [Citricoccus sp. K5]
MDIGLLSAFLGGVLALLSPCAALLMPAFFASTVGAGPRLLAHGAVFYVGLLLVLVPLGVGAGAIGTLFATHREVIVLSASVLLVVLGVVQLLGFGFDPARLLPGAAHLQERATTATGWAKTLLLGAASGVAGFCAGPILGAVLTLAAARGDMVSAGTLLAVYGAGMVAPLLLIAALWGRLGARGRRVLRGRAFTVFGRELHSTSMLTGFILIGVGVVFWTTNGLVTAPELLPLEAQAWLQEGSAVLANPVVDILAILVLVCAVLIVWARRRRRDRSTAGTRPVGGS